MLILGYDPGGKRANGVALLHTSENWTPRAWVYTCDSVDQALCWIKKEMQKHEFKTVDAAGIDTYMSWSTHTSGWRPMDEFLKKTYQVVERSVFSSNSAFGSMAVQGMAMALRLRELWPDIHLNETHPKVLYYAISGNRYEYGRAMTNWLLGQFEHGLDICVHNDHEWDALFSTWATRQGRQGIWGNDLMQGKMNSLLLPAGEVSYYWPCCGLLQKEDT